MKHRVLALLSIPLLIATLGAAACAAKTPLAKAQVGALTVGQIVLDIRDAERQVYAGKLPQYGATEHRAVLEQIVNLEYAARGYERAVAAWPPGQSIPQAVITAKAGLNAALADLQKALPAVQAVRDPMNRAIAALVAWLADPKQARLTARPSVSFSELPLAALLAAMQLVANLLNSGRTAWSRLREFLQKEGATPEELAAIDAKLTTAIAEDEAELARTPPAGG